MLTQIQDPVDLGKCYHHLLNSTPDDGQDAEGGIVKSDILGQKRHCDVLCKKTNKSKKCNELPKGGLVPGELLPQKEEHGRAFAIDEEDLQDENRGQEDDEGSHAVFSLPEGGLERRLEVLQVKDAGANVFPLVVSFSGVFFSGSL